MKSEFRSLLAILISIGIFAVWYGWLFPPPKAEPKTEVSQSVESKTDTPVVENESSAEIPSVIPEETRSIETDLYRVVFSNRGGIPTLWEFKKFSRKNEDKKEEPIDAVNKGAIPLLFQFSEASSPWSNQVAYRVEEKGVGEKKEITFISDEKGLRVKKKFLFEEGQYATQMEVSVQNRGGKEFSARPSLLWDQMDVHSKPGGFFSFLKGPPDQWMPLYLMDGEVEREKWEKENKTATGKIYWVAVANRYFLSAILPKSGALERSVSWEARESGNGGKISISLPKIHLAPGETWKENFTVYVGPQDIEQLKHVGNRLEDAVDLGFFGIVARPILYLLKLFYLAVHNYGVAIILLTLLIKLLLHPINKKSMTSMKAMQALQPRLKEIREKYKNDKQRLQMEMMNLFKTNKVNPMGGCLPMLLQFPIYIALYKVLWSSVELYQAPFFWFYKDLSAPDPYLISPVLLGIAMFLQQKMMPSATMDPAQQKMMMFMPLMFSAFMLFLPSGLTIYILVNTVISIVQQWMIQKDLRLRDILRGRFYG